MTADGSFPVYPQYTESTSISADRIPYRTKNTGTLSRRSTVRTSSPMPHISTSEKHSIGHV